jgi:hypothetical protein
MIRLFCRSLPMATAEGFDASTTSSVDEAVQQLRTRQRSRLLDCGCREQTIRLAEGRSRGQFRSQVALMTGPARSGPP